MISADKKEQFLEELGRAGNIFIAAAKVGISRQTYYRWRIEDKKFKKLALVAIKNGRGNMCDMAEHALMRNVKEGDMTAIKYVLGHNSKRYKANRQTHVIFEHKGEEKHVCPPQHTLEDCLKVLGYQNDEIQAEQQPTRNPTQTNINSENDATNEAPTPKPERIPNDLTPTSGNENHLDSSHT